MNFSSFLLRDGEHARWVSVLGRGVARVEDELADLTGRELRLELGEMGSASISAASIISASGYWLRITAGFRGDAVGAALMLLSSEAAHTLSALLMGKATGEDVFDGSEQSALLEISHAVLGHLINAFLPPAVCPLTFALPQLQIRRAAQDREIFRDDPATTEYVAVPFRLALGHLGVTGWLAWVAGSGQWDSWRRRYARAAMP